MSLTLMSYCDRMKPMILLLLLVLAAVVLLSSNNGQPVSVGRIIIQVVKVVIAIIVIKIVLFVVTLGGLLYLGNTYLR